MTITVFCILLFAALLHASWNAIVKASGDKMYAAIGVSGSAALIALVLAWSWNALRSDRLASAQILICAAALACAGQGSLYLKDVDFFFWPLLLMRLLRWGAHRPALRESLLQAAILWTGIALTLATLSYPTL